MVKKDQRMRRSGKWDAQIDRDNTKQMEEIIRRYDWPGIALVGKKAAEGTWLLVQHADHNLRFQKKCLKLLEEAVKENDAEKKHIAYLTDRILVHQKKKQIYGTQFYFNRKTKELLPRSIKNRRNLEKLRMSVGLEPFCIYKERLEKLCQSKK